MKAILTGLFFMGLVATGHAVETNYYYAAYYWCQQNGHTNVSLDLSEVLNMKESKGALSYICSNADSWKIGSPPSKADLEALDQEAAATAFKDAKADVKAERGATKTEILGLMDSVNVKLKALGSKEITEKELLSAIEAREKAAASITP